MLTKLNNMSIRLKLVIAFILTGILPLLVTGYYGSILATKALMEKSFDQMVAVQSIRTSQLESVFRQRFMALKQLARSSQMLSFSQGLIHSFDQNGSPSGIISRPHSAQARENGNHLKRFSDAFGCQEIKIVDRDYGRILFSLNHPDAVGQRLNQNTWSGTHLSLAYKTVLTTDHTAIIDFMPFEPDGGVETAFFAEPVIDNDGRIVSIVIVQVTPAFINRIMESRKGLGRTGESYILHYDMLEKRFEFRSNVLSMGDSTYVPGFSLGRTLSYWTDALDKGYDGGSGTYTDSRGKGVLATYNKLNINGLNWYLISKIDKYEVQETVRDILGKTLGLSSVLIALVGLCAYLLSRTISTPIINAVQFAQAIARGNFSTAIEIRQQDELGKLAGALNHMARTLRESDWLKQGKEGLDDVLRGELSQRELGRRFISFISQHIGVEMGALYIHREGQLKLYASYAFSDRKGNHNTLAMGEGMVGQAALEQEIIVFTDVRDDNAPLINYGVDEKPAKSYIIVPLVFENETLGVFLLAS